MVLKVYGIAFFCRAVPAAGGYSDSCVLAVIVIIDAAGLIKISELAMKKLKNEKDLVKKAIELGMKYGEQRGVVEFEATDSANEKIEYIYRLLVHDKLLQPLPEDKVSQKSMKHKLAIWASRQK